MLEVTLELGGMRRRHCFFCCGSTNKDHVQARIYEDGEYTHHVVCEACLALSSADRTTQLHRRAQECREFAASLDTLADELPALPSYDEWAEANAAAEDECLKDMPAEERARLGPNVYRMSRHELFPDYDG